MKTLSFWKKSVYSGLVFFGTLIVLSVGYSLVGNLSTADKVGSGSGLTATSWNRIVDGILDLDTRLSKFSFSGSNVGIGTASPNKTLDVQGSVNITGNLYRPNLPAFSVQGVMQNFTSAWEKDLDYTLGARSFNIGNYFNDTTNKFTAPITGIYWFSANCRYDGADVGYFRLYFSVNDGGLDTSLPHSIADFGTRWQPNYATQTIVGLVRLNAGDTIKVVADAQGDTAWLHQGEDTFNGYLVSGL